MTLDEAIKHAEEVAEEKEKHINETFATFGEDRHLFEEEENECKKCADEHRQLAEWLKDYKRLKEQEPCEDAISREDAILQIQKHQICSGDPEECYPEQCERNIISWLSNLPSVSPTSLPSEDCVSRQAVLERINDWWGITATSGEPSLCDYIRELPPVTPTRKKGKWIKEYVGCMYDVCSECRQKIVSGYFEFNYCPNCGAEMESE